MKVFILEIGECSELGSTASIKVHNSLNFNSAANMAGPADESLQLSFPLPPSLYKVYTDQNVKEENTPRPPQPISGVYSMFGAKFETDEDILRPLESQGIPRLYSRTEKFDHLAEMKKLNHSILVNFLEMLDVLIEAPSSQERVRKIEDINVLFINLHHLINEFRPHQARETLRVMLHRQKSQRLETADKLKQHIEKAKALLKDCHGILSNLKIGHSDNDGMPNTFVNEDVEMDNADLLDESAEFDSILCNLCDSIV